MTETSRYIVGLDLGTTNCALAYIDTGTPDDEGAHIESFPVAQLIAAGEVGAEPLLPSFLYLPAEGEMAKSELSLPWDKSRAFAVGRFAREHGSRVPTRLVASAKSWLCHGGVDRRAAILPWGGEDDGPKTSPLEASARFLEHLRDAWNAMHGRKDKGSRLEQQQIVLTVPASFDAVARELTVEAARLAGLEQVTLFEEPQAAFYAWVHGTGEEWRRQVRVGDVVLVVDVGGGTTDLTLIAVTEHEGHLALERIAVGDHLLLGGDNMDLTLAHQLAAAWTADGTKLDTGQMLQLWHACRRAKEQLFADTKRKAQPVTVLGRGRKLVGGTLRTELTAELADKVLLDGFFPLAAADIVPKSAAGIGLRELGLPYQSDAAVTRHLAAFLTRNAAAISKCRPSDSQAAHLPTCVLFNGGVFRADPFRQRVLDVITAWSQESDGDAVRELPSFGLEHAAARGAAYYGLVRRGKGVRIRGGVARAYYVGVETAMPAVPGMDAPIKALCVVPHGTEEGAEIELPGREFGLVVGEPVEFRFLGSAQRREDGVGSLIDDWQETIDELAPLQTTLESGASAGQTIPVTLHAKVTEIGTLELWFQSRDAKNRWKLEFGIRDAR